MAALLNSLLQLGATLMRRSTGRAREPLEPVEPLSVLPDEFEVYLQDIPNLHSWDGGRTWNSGGFDKEHLSQIVSVIRGRFVSPRIIETGAGNSTISFLFCSPEVVMSICPDKELFDKIETYCIDHSIQRSALRCVCGFSEDVLPGLAQRDTKETFDIALIDGNHGWPVVFVDFCYVNRMLPVGGLLIIDDVNLHSVRELVNLLREQPGYSTVLDLGKALVFEKTMDIRDMPEWDHQPYISRLTASS